MNHVLADRVLLLSLVGSIVLAVHRVRGVADAPPGNRAAAVTPATPERPDRATLGRLAVGALRTAPFRLSAQAPTVRFGADTSPPAVISRVLPPITVEAIVGGPPWSARLSGLPGTSGPTVVRLDDTFETVVVRAIDRGSVTLSLADTAWTVPLRGANR